VSVILHVLIRLLALFRSKHRPAPLTDEPAVMVCAASGLGDTLMALPLVESIRIQFPRARLSILTTSIVAPFVKGTGLAEAVHILPGHFLTVSYWRMLRRIRQDQYSHFIGAMPCNTARQVLIPLFCGIRDSTKHKSPHGGVRNYDFLYTRVIEFEMNRHRRLSNQDLLTALTGSTAQPFKKLSIAVSSHPDLMSDTRPLVAIHPGCRREALFKRWPADRFSKVASELDKAGVRVVLIGGPDETEDLNRVRQSLDVAVIDLAGRLTLLETAGVLRRCRCLLSNDSGIMHLASALAIPVIAIFGPTDENHIGPWSERSCVVRKGTRVEDVDVPDVMRELERSRLLLPANHREA